MERMSEEPQEVKTESPPEPKGEEAVKPESAPATEDAKPEEQPKKKGGGFQKRIDKLTRTVYELQAKLESERHTKNASPADEKEPKRDDFEDLESYQRSLAEHTAKRVVKEHHAQEAEARKQESAREANARRKQSWESHVEKVSEKHDDGDDVIEHFVANVNLHAYALDAIIESELGGEIAYYLGKHDEEAERISKLTPPRQALEIGKLEVKLSTPKKPSAAPAPIDPVGGKGSASTGLDHALPTGEWIKRRQKQVHG